MTHKQVVCGCLCGLAMRKEIHARIGSLANDAPTLQPLLFHFWFGKHEAAFRQENKMEWQVCRLNAYKHILTMPLVADSMYHFTMCSIFRCFPGQSYSDMAAFGVKRGLARRIGKKR